MTQLGEAIAVTTITDPDRPHWVQVEYKYANGRPVKGQFLATDSEGMTWAGTLNDQGQACLSGLPPGSVEFELVSEDMEDELARTRADIKAVLDQIIEEQRAEAAQHEAALARQSAVGQAASHYGAYVKGIWNGAVGLVTFIKDTAVKTAEVALYLSPFERLSNALHAAYKSYHDGELNAAQWKQSFIQNLQDEEIKDIARILGIDPSHLSPEGLQNLKNLFAEAYEITAFIADDPESLDMLTQFGKDYAGAQSTIEWAEFAGGGVFEIVLTALLLMFTGGVGNVVQGASKIRHAGKLKSLGSIFRNLGRLLKRKKLQRKVRVEVDSKKSIQTELPKGSELRVRPRRDIKDIQVAGLQAKQIRQGSNGKVAIIGRSMGDPSRNMVGVRDYASGLQKEGYDVEIFDGDKIPASATDEFKELASLAKAEYEAGHRTNKYLTPEEVRKTELFMENEKWAEKLKAEGYTVVDIGNPHRLGESPFYDIELKILFGGK